jgi:hypothetical protein
MQELAELAGFGRGHRTLFSTYRSVCVGRLILIIGGNNFSDKVEIFSMAQADARDPCTASKFVGSAAHVILLGLPTFSIYSLKEFYGSFLIPRNPLFKLYVIVHYKEKYPISPASQCKINGHLIITDF